MLLDKDAVLPGHGRVSELAKPIEKDVWVLSNEAN
jgi:hypothetical protein